MKQAMIITVGTGSTVAHGISRAIQDHHPEFVFFIGTEESIQKTLPAVLETSKLEENQYEIRTTQRPNDVERISMECVEHIKCLMHRGYRPEEIVADFTSGTKAMSAGLVVATFIMETGSVSYVHGERDQNGRVISGTERVTSIEPNRLLAEKRITLAIRLFNRYQFDSSLAVLSEVEGLIKTPDIVEKVTLLSRLTKAYSAWDRFELKAAIELLGGLENHPLASQWGIKKQLKHNNNTLHLEEKSQYSSFRAVDLLENAKRRAEEGKFDDAVARLYRLIEYLAQVKLHNDYGRLLTDNLDITALPNKLQGKYEQLKNSKQKLELGLTRSYELLEDLDDPLGKQFMEDYRRKGEIRVVLRMRNASILAHGFGPVGEGAYCRSIRVIQECLDLTFDNWRRIVPMVQFPKLRENPLS